MTANQVALSYLAASVLFILSLRGLSHPLTARRGNLFGGFVRRISVAGLGIVPGLLRRRRLRRCGRR